LKLEASCFGGEESSKLCPKTNSDKVPDKGWLSWLREKEDPEPKAIMQIVNTRDFSGRRSNWDETAQIPVLINVLIRMGCIVGGI
jgi:hypothetical protein